MTDAKAEPTGKALAHLESGRTSPNPYRPGWQGSDGESEGESAARGGCCIDCGGKSHEGPCCYRRPEPLAREALASARLDAETHCLPDAEGPRGAREATAGWPVEEPGVLQRLRAEPQGAPKRKRAKTPGINGAR